ncbi:MAG: hypothetical protein JKY50_02630 [Oleispira sp.]|nr:hypothetical protein [Oleispira sp.]MBL4880005.1 hypothetical protein [Oleispira sp.]
MNSVFKVAKESVTIICMSLIAVGFAWSEENTEEEETASPWIATPLISSDPKLSTSIGGLVAYMHKFDDVSPASMFGLSATYSNTDSFVLAGFGKMYFDNDKQRALFAVARGTIHNDYDDYLGSGMPLKTTDELNFQIARYSYRVYGDWFAGMQAISSNYTVVLAEEIAQSAFNDTSAAVSNNELIELAGFESKALGLTIEFDDRDRQRAATAGQLLQFNNMAYREEFGGDISFDAYQLKYTTYLSHGDGNVLAISSNARWTVDAPVAAYSSVNVKGYTRGQFLGPHSADLQIDERINLTNDWGLIAYAAVACLYGETTEGYMSCSDTDNIFPSLSLGATYTINQEEGIVVRSEIAKGKGSSKGFYMTFGHPF